MDARHLIFAVLSGFEVRPGGFERIVDESLGDPRMDRRDKRFVFEIVYGVVRRRLTLDYFIGRLLDSKSLAKNNSLRTILRIGLYQIMYMDRVPHHASVNEAVKLAKSFPETRALSGVVNGVLRRIVADHRLITLPTDNSSGLAERLSIEFSHPPWMIERWLKHFGLASTKRLLSFNNEKPETYLRRKLRGFSRHQFESEIRSLCDPASGYLNLYYRLKKNIPRETISALCQGSCIVQAPSSGWVVALVEAERGDKILDLCSAPGGKSAMLSEIVGDTGSVCACDDKWDRILLTLDTARRMNCSNIYPLLCDGRYPPFDGYFDTVLLDAPCSATGVLHRHPDARWTRKPSDIDSAAALQRALLESASRLVGVGGIIVYSVCSIEPEEGIEQIRSFLSSHPEFTHAGCPASIPPTYLDSQGYFFITPFSAGLDGMFGARLKKTA